jgi:hypothetical protein
MVTDFADFPGKIVDVSIANAFGISGCPAVWMLMAVVATAFPFIFVAVARFIRRRRGYSPDDVTVAIFNRIIFTVAMDVVTACFRHITPVVFMMLFTHVSLPPLLFTIIYVGRPKLGMRPKAEKVEKQIPGFSIKQGFGPAKAK